MCAIGEKSDISVANAEELGASISALLETIQRSLFEKARSARDEKIVQVTEWKDFVPALERQCMVLTPFCDQKEWEEKVKVG